MSCRWVAKCLCWIKILICMVINHVNHKCSLKVSPIRILLAAERHKMERSSLSVYQFPVWAPISHPLLPPLNTIMKREWYDLFPSVYQKKPESLFARISSLHKHDIMSGVLYVKPIGPFTNLIVAVNGYNMELIQLLIKYSVNHCFRNFHLPVRFFGNSFNHVNARQTTDLAKYKGAIWEW